MLFSAPLLLASTLSTTLPAPPRAFHDLSIGICLSEQARLDPQASHETLLQRCLQTSRQQTG